MIAHVVRLAVGEWRKLRRRWFPWILLGIIVVIVQAIVWGGYVVYHVDGDADEDLLGGLTLPSSITFVTETPELYVIPLMVLAASVMGVEYGWGTLRATLTRGVGRWQLLSAKIIMLVAVGIAGVVVTAALGGVASLLAGVVPPDEEGTRVVTEAAAWRDAAIGIGKAACAIAPYVALSVFFTVLTQSTAQGVSLSLGYYVLEQIAPAVGGLSERIEDVLNVALLGPNTAEWTGAAGDPDTLRAFLVILVHTTVLVAAAIWVFQRRDVAGARGE